MTKLSSRAICHQLGIDAAILREGYELSFVPGHLIRDGSGKLTDILLVATKPGEAVQRILGVFEIKAYEGGAAELRGVLQTTAEGVPKTLANIESEAAAQIAYRAEIEFNEAMAHYVANPGVLKAPVLAEIEQRMLQEYFVGGSQIMHDAARLGAGKVTEILIDSVPTKVVLDAAVRFYAVAPREVAALLSGGGGKALTPPALEGASGVLQATGQAVRRPDAMIRAYEGMESALAAAGYPTIYWGLSVTRPELNVLVKVFQDIGMTVGKL